MNASSTCDHPQWRDDGVPASACRGGPFNHHSTDAAIPFRTGAACSVDGYPTGCNPVFATKGSARPTRAWKWLPISSDRFNVMLRRVAALTDFSHVRCVDVGTSCARQPTTERGEAERAAPDGNEDSKRSRQTGLLRR